MAEEAARSQGAVLFQLRAINLARKRNQPLGPVQTEWLGDAGSLDLEQLPPADQRDLQDLRIDVD